MKDYIKQLESKIKDCKNTNTIFDTRKYVLLEDAKDILNQALAIPVVSNCAIWKPTMILRWYETDNYNAINDDFDKVLQQKWQSSECEEKWEDIEVYGR